MITSNFGHKGSFKYDFYGKNSTFFKGGKGYLSNGKPQGVLKQKCTEYSLTEKIQTPFGLIPKRCDGNIIAIKITTNNKGFCTTSEEVCEKCGKLHNTAFQVINKSRQKYSTMEFTTHNVWLEEMKKSEMGNPEDISLDNEMFVHAKGRRLNTTDNYYYGSPGKDESGNFKSQKKYYQNVTDKKKKLAKDLGLNTWKSEFSNRDSEEVKQWKRRQYYNYVDVCKSRLEMTKGQAEEVRYIIDKQGLNYYNNKGQADYEEIILTICLYVKTRPLNFQRKGTLLSKFFRIDSNLKHLYPVVKQKIES